MERTLYGNQFLTLIERDGYTFVREVRCNANIVAVLPFRNRRTTRQYLARLETCPAHTYIEAQPELCSITGGVDPGRTPLQTAELELLEEAGYGADPNQFVNLGTVRPSKAMDTVAHLYAVDVTGLRRRSADGDGSRWEGGASVEWVGDSAGLTIGDPLFIAALARFTALESAKVTSGTPGRHSLTSGTDEHETD